MFENFAPDLLLTYGSHPVVREALHRGRRRGVMTVFTLRNHGFDDRQWFHDVDHVFTTSPYLSDVYRQKIGLISTGIPSPIDWSEVLAPAEPRWTPQNRPSIDTSKPATTRRSVRDRLRSISCPPLGASRCAPWCASSAAHT